MVRQFAPAFLRHTPVGRTTQEHPYTAAAHARYIMGKRKAERVFTEGLYQDSQGRLRSFPRHWHAVQRLLMAREDGLRKNGRVCDKFIISIPREFAADHAEQVLRQFGKRIGQGRAPFLATFHWNAHNPHAHIIFIDADPETGRRIFGTSEWQSTVLLKQAWADECNAIFAELGLETRLHFKDIADDIPPEINLHEEPANDNEAIMADNADHPRLQGADAVREGLFYAAELDTLDTLQTNRDTIRADIERLQAEQAALEAQAQEAHRSLQVASGRLKSIEAAHQQLTAGFLGRGIRLKAFGWEWKSKHRQEVERLEQSAERLAYEQSAYQAQYEEITAVVRAHREAIRERELQARDAHNALQNRMQLEGTEEELQQARAHLDKEKHKHLNWFNALDITDMYHSGQLTLAEAQQALLAMGEREAARDLEGNGIEQ